MKSLFPGGHEWPSNATESHKRTERLRAALVHAFGFALHSATTFGEDMPVGAVVFRGDKIIGVGFASDRRLGDKTAHAEIMALNSVGRRHKRDHHTLVTTYEPCNGCQDRLTLDGALKEVSFCTPKSVAVALGLVRPNDEDIFTRARRLEYPYDVSRIDDKPLGQIGLGILQHVSRDLSNEEVFVDPSSMVDTLGASTVSRLVDLTQPILTA